MKLQIRNGFPVFVIKVLCINNGVKIYRELLLPSKPINFLQDIILLIRSLFNRHTINHNDEAGVYLSHLRTTRVDDKVLAVGLGSGSTLIPIVKIIDSNLGFYRCIEASKSQIEVAKKNINLNNIDGSKFEIINAFAGSEVYGVYGESSKKNVDVNDFQFDVLELDCEGSELSILFNLNKKPRNIIVELHPGLFIEDYKDYQDFDYFLKFMGSKGFEYQFAYGHNGDYLDIQYARLYFNSSSILAKRDYFVGNRELHFFNSVPIVVTFIYNQFNVSY